MVPTLNIFLLLAECSSPIYQEVYYGFKSCTPNPLLSIVITHFYQARKIMFYVLRPAAVRSFFIKDDW